MSAADGEMEKRRDKGRLRGAKLVGALNLALAGFVLGALVARFTGGG